MLIGLLADLNCIKSKSFGNNYSKNNVNMSDKMSGKELVTKKELGIDKKLETKEELTIKKKTWDKRFKRR